jgi:hypothetical protein
MRRYRSSPAPKTSGFVFSREGCGNPLDLARKTKPEV